MATGTILAIGAGMQITGNIMANHAQAKAERRNAEFLEKQGQLSALRTARRIDAFKTESAQFIGQKISTIAKSGVDLSGSLLAQLAGDQAAIGRDLNALAMQGENEAMLIQMRRDQAFDNADRLESFSHNILQAGSTGMQSYANYKMISAKRST